jgi:CheY-like chemotaxis protein
MARILVADDDAPIRDLVALACGLDGHEVRAAVDTASAVAAYLAAPPDLLVLDIQMPGGGGPVVLAQLRQAKPEGLCPVLVLSGYLDQMSEAALETLAADAMLGKPVTVDRLRGEVARLLARRRS